jgi:hypothetical protein
VAPRLVVATVLLAGADRQLEQALARRKRAVMVNRDDTSTPGGV